jgi:AcrR family transcriptional regulator
VRSVEELRRGEIADGAIRLLAREGLEGLTMRALAAELGVSTGTITHWYASKDEVLAAALDAVARRVAGRLDEALAGVDAPLDVLLAIGDASVPETADEADEQRVWLELAARAGRAPGLAERHAGLYGGWRRRIERAVREGLEAGDFAAVEPREWALRYAALLDGLALHVLLHPADVTPAGMRTAIRGHIAETLDRSAARRTG